MRDDWCAMAQQTQRLLWPRGECLVDKLTNLIHSENHIVGIKSYRIHIFWEVAELKTHTDDLNFQDEETPSQIIDNYHTDLISVFPLFATVV